MIQRIQRFTAAACLFAVAAFAAQAEIDPETIVGAWLFDDNAGNTASDSSENGFDGEINGAEWDDGVFGSALSFDGDDWVSIASDPALQIGDELTMMAYFFAEDIDSWRQLIAKSDEYLLRIDPPGEGNRMSAFVKAGGSWEPRAASRIPELDTWIHFAAVYRANPAGAERSLMLYVDGALHEGGADRQGNIAPTENPVDIGRWNNGSYFIGLIDEAAIFNAALSEEDILGIKEDGLQVALSGGLAATAAGKMAVLWANIRNGN